jgi:hypothetical protein
MVRDADDAVAGGPDLAPPVPGRPADAPPPARALTIHCGRPVDRVTAQEDVAGASGHRIARLRAEVVRPHPTLASPGHRDS